MRSHFDHRHVAYEHRAPRWAHAVSLLATLVLMGAAAYALFGGEVELDTTFRLLAWLLIGFGAFLAVVFGYRLVCNPPYFAIYADGFEYAPGGVSVGLIRWTDVVELKEETVLDATATISAVRRPVTAVVLRNPEEYIKRFPAVLRPLCELRMKSNSSFILIPEGEFGRDRVAIMSVLREQIAKAAARKG